MTATRAQAHAKLDLVPEENVEQVLNFIITFTGSASSEKEPPVKIGVGKGKFKAPDDFDANNEEAAAMLEEYALS